jgi:membrane protease YdiL (CAAX protease family)
MDSFTRRSIATIITILITIFTHYFCPYLGKIKLGIAYASWNIFFGYLIIDIGITILLYFLFVRILSRPSMVDLIAMRFPLVQYLILAPILEELLFRYMLYNISIDLWGSFGYFGNAFFFGLVHVAINDEEKNTPILSLIARMSMGILACAVYAATGEILIVILFHSAHNLFIIILRKII